MTRLTCSLTVALAAFVLVCAIASASRQAIDEPTDAKSQIVSASSSSSLASKLLPAKLRSPRSLGDMMEKVKNRIFGKKQQTSSGSSGTSTSSATNSQLAQSASANIPSRQTWGDLNSFNQAFNPYTPLSSYQWPAGSQQQQQQFINQYNPLGYLNPSGAPLSLDGTAQGQQQISSVSSPVNSNNVASSSGGGLLSSASQLISHYLSPAASSSSTSSAVASLGALPVASSAISSIVPQSQIGAGANQQMPAQSQLSPQQQQQQNSYNEFSSLLDSMVMQSGVASQRNQVQPQAQFNPSQQQAQQQQQQSSVGGPFVGSNNAQMMADQDMSASNSIQSYMPSSNGIAPQQSGQQQAQQKSSMVSLAEQLAPGAQFNKLVSFPFSLSTNEDPTKEGRFKLHIPFVNQHVKRSDQQQQVANQNAANALALSQQQQRQLNQYVSSYLGQQQQQQQAASSPFIAQASQFLPSIVSSNTELRSQSSPSSSSLASASSMSSASSSLPSASSSSSSSSSLSSVSASSSPSSSSASVSSLPASSSISSALPSQVSSSSQIAPQSAQSQSSRNLWSGSDLAQLAQHHQAAQN